MRTFHHHIHVNPQNPFNLFHMTYKEVWGCLLWPKPPPGQTSGCVALSSESRVQLQQVRYPAEDTVGGDAQRWAEPGARSRRAVRCARVLVSPLHTYTRRSDRRCFRSSVHYSTQHPRTGTAPYQATPPRSKAAISTRCLLLRSPSPAGVVRTAQSLNPLHPLLHPHPPHHRLLPV